MLVHEGVVVKEEREEEKVGGWGRPGQVRRWRSGRPGGMGGDVEGRGGEGVGGGVGSSGRGKLMGCEGYGWQSEHVHLFV